ncbi:hypothetical protein HYFRA_00008329 [Hymenoscyphus fraxineus]|uniref:Alpha/beta hydrolase fold-3 domain-containing protein n=1 Tax=Hymenoscyphus fraxineus TaxID=746836 RepID=A0A9N9KLV8_9HELO|nr:hypothetical protein HYFRA_00008329 [Hymenoscyphus fraxineus]
MSTTSNKLYFTHPPPLSPTWLAHEKATGLNLPKPIITNPLKRRENYEKACSELNKILLSGRDEYLNHGLEVRDTFIPSTLVAGHEIPVRVYTPHPTAPHPQPPTNPQTKNESETVNGVILNPPKKPQILYLHGGGLVLGSPHTEDLTCRRISLSLSVTVYSIAYRLLPEHSADEALSDALSAFRYLTTAYPEDGVVVVGSSSGGQLAGQVVQVVLREEGGDRDGRRIKGVVLRGPVLCDATNLDFLPERFRGVHTSLSTPFYTSLLSIPALTPENRTVTPLPLEFAISNLSKLPPHQPKHYIQVCTNDIYYSDGVLYAEILREQGVDVRLDVVVGYPHTFWLKAPFLERAVRAEGDMLGGLRWILEG